MGFIRRGLKSERSVISTAILSLLAIVLTIWPVRAYSREFERQADAFAVAELRRLGIDPEVFAQALERLELSRNSVADSAASATEQDEDINKVHRKLLEYLASHPITADRIAAVRGVPSP
mgnify:CR=1 FL=1